MIDRIRKNVRKISFIFFLIHLFTSLSPTISWALTSGPVQPEVQSFQQATTSEMVDLFTGDFNYNIPLFELPGPNGGYPFNLSYQAGITVDQEASWVGLGWSLQPGSITRQMRGLPDEFNGDPVTTKVSMKTNTTIGLSAGGNVEFFGGDKGLNVGVSVYHNSYRGYGYSIDGTVGFEKATKSGMNTSLNLGFSLDSQEGLTLSPSLSMSGRAGEIGLSSSYNRLTGLSNVGLNINSNLSAVSNSSAPSVHASSSLSFAYPGYTPQISLPMKNVNTKLTLKGGGAFWGLFGNVSATAYLNTQSLAKQNLTSQAYGYLNYQFADDKALLDFNREKDGPVSKTTPNLPAPALTHDIYSVTGQGIGMMFRPMRNDFGIVHDPVVTSDGTAVGVGVDVAAWASKVGLNLDLNLSRSKSGIWIDDNDATQSTKSKFRYQASDSEYEPWYFKVHGEPASDDYGVYNSIGQDRAASFQLNGSRDVVTLGENLNANGLTQFQIPNNETNNLERKSRASNITAITNKDLLLPGSSPRDPILNLFKIKFINGSGIDEVYNRDSQDPHHFAGYITTTKDGLRYVYALPAYNTKHEEVTFSVVAPSAEKGIVEVGNNTGGIEDDPAFNASGTDEYLKKTNIPKYAHSYLLTGIVGPDYIDVNNNGIDELDLGYWVKFTYNRTSANFQWRDPFVGAHLNEGWKTDAKDDKGSFTFGVREVWYLARAETKSHIAEFIISNLRTDGFGANKKLQDPSTSVKTDQGLHKLESISLKSRLSNIPIKVVKFQHSQTLCPGILNGATGKLTLDKVWFEYGGSARGALNPYEFTYAANPNYDFLAFDRWGYYKSYPAGQFSANRDFPYTPQDPSYKTTLDANVSAWSLKKIKLPSGGEILVDYEVDDYAFVQNKTAMQMVQLVDPNTASTSTTLQDPFDFDPFYSKIRFKLESPINVAGTNALTEVKKYIDQQNWQLYFKVNVQLTKSGTQQYETISGYVDIDQVGSMGLEVGTDPNKYQYGYFNLKKEKGGTNFNGQQQFVNPIVLRAWQHLRTNQPELTNNPKSDAPGIKDEVKRLIPLIPAIVNQLRGFNRDCFLRGVGMKVKSSKSWVRLNSPDNIKYGGGLRVKQVTMRDANWAATTVGKDEEVIYGHVYDYTTQDENNRTISSGVAAYEPFVGGDENALRYAKTFTESVPLRADNNLFFEYPLNESYYPGAHVGYSKVTVKSLASAALAGQPGLDIPLPSGGKLLPGKAIDGFQYGTSGKVVHEFYTARDFPVVPDETKKSYKNFPLAVSLFGLGNITISKLTCSQGYSIITNDMHGKPKKVSTYKQIKDTGAFDPTPDTYVQYNYLTEDRMANGTKVKVLSNVMRDLGNGMLGKDSPTALAALPAAQKKFLGQEVDFFYDMREFRDLAAGGGVRLNTDIVNIPLLGAMIPIPIPTGWPNLNFSENQLRTAVANKIIFRGGILESIEAFDGGSLVKTENLKWDKLTGQVVLTSVTNNFNAPIFTYTKLAHTEYQGMGAAYSTEGLLLNVSNVTADAAGTGWYRFYSLLSDKLYPGDELILYSLTDRQPLAKVFYMGKIDGAYILQASQAIPDKEYEGLVIRSGRRNQLTVAAQTLTGLADPSIPGTAPNVNKTVLVPK
jgi:hypothetical protein